MNWVSRFTIFPVAILLLALVFTSCRGRESGTNSAPSPEEASSKGAEAVPEAPEVPSDRAPTAETPSAGQPAPPAAPLSSEPSEPTPATRPDRDPTPPPPAPPPDPAPPAEPEPQIIEVTVPDGTVLELELLTALDTSVNQAGDEIQARTLSPIYVKGEVVLPKGTYVEGRVTEVQASGRVKGRARLAFTFDRLSTRTGLKEIRTSYVDQEAESGKKKDATVVGGGAGLGAIVGGIIGGKKGAAIGAAIGGAGGTGVVLATKGEEIRLPVGAEVNVRLDDPVVLQLN